MAHPQLDLSVFRWIESQTTESDRRALLSIKEVMCARGSYRYLEIGSHLGGSLQPHMIDTRCLDVYSIDPRPADQRDERWTSRYRYEGNSTERMLGLLAQIPNADLAKLHTFEKSAVELSATSIPALTDFAFIDAEHTNRAVMRDFHAIRKFLLPTSVVAFHDCFVTPSALLRIARALRRERSPHRFLYFPDSSVVAIVFTSATLADALIEFGWQEQLPISHWQSMKLFAVRHLHSLYDRLRHNERRAQRLPAA